MQSEKWCGRTKERGNEFGFGGRKTFEEVSEVWGEVEMNSGEAAILIDGIRVWVLRLLV